MIKIGLNQTFINIIFLSIIMPKKSVKKAESKELITKDMAIGEAVAKYPNTVPVFLRNGLHCIGCAVANYESIEQGASGHGIDADKLLKELNAAAKKKK